MKTEPKSDQKSLLGNDAAISAAVGSDAPELLQADTHLDDLETLAAKFDARLQSSGGRPSDPSRTLTRQVPFSEGTWSSLRARAEDISKVTGYRVSASQLGGQLIEEGLDRLDQAADQAWNQRTMKSSPKKE